MLRKIVEHLYKSAEAHGEHEIEKAMAICRSDGILLDVGCWDGVNTIRWKKAMEARKVLGIELVPLAINKARKKGIEVIKSDIDNQSWPIKSGSVDCVVSNLVIEHMSHVDRFISESYRVLRSGGYTVVGTNNLSSWHNILSLLLGWAPFDLANTSEITWEIGNPLVLHKNQSHDRGGTFSHRCVYTSRWLKEWYELYGFKFIRDAGSGYYPFSPAIGNIDKIHAALLTLVFKK